MGTPTAGAVKSCRKMTASEGPQKLHSAKHSVSASFPPGDDVGAMRVADENVRGEDKLRRPKAVPVSLRQPEPSRITFQT